MIVKDVLLPDPIHKLCPANTLAHVEPLALLAFSGVVKSLHAVEIPQKNCKEVAQGAIHVCWPLFSAFCMCHTRLSKLLNSYTNKLCSSQINAKHNKVQGKKDYDVNKYSACLSHHVGFELTSSVSHNDVQSAPQVCAALRKPCKSLPSMLISHLTVWSVHCLRIRG